MFFNTLANGLKSRHLQLWREPVSGRDSTLLLTRADRLYSRWSPSLLMATGDSHRWITPGNDNDAKEGIFPHHCTLCRKAYVRKGWLQCHYGAGQCTVTALVSTVCHALLAWNSGSTFFSVSGVARQERAMEAEQRLARDREADRLERDKEADRLARKSVARECRGIGVGQCIVTALVSTVCHAPLAWNSGPIPIFTPPTMVHYAQAF